MSSAASSHRGSNMCLEARADTTDIHAAPRPDRPKPVHSKGSGKTGCEVIRGHRVWAEKLKSCNTSENCGDMCKKQPTCSRALVCAVMFNNERSTGGEYGMFSCEVLLQVSGREEIVRDLAEISESPGITFWVFITDVVTQLKNTAGLVLK